MPHVAIYVALSSSVNIQDVRLHMPVDCMHFCTQTAFSLETYTRIAGQ